MVEAYNRVRTKGGGRERGPGGHTAARIDLEITARSRANTKKTVSEINQFSGNRGTRDANGGRWYAETKPKARKPKEHQRNCMNSVATTTPMTAGIRMLGQQQTPIWKIKKYVATRDANGGRWCFGTKAKART